MKVNLTSENPQRPFAASFVIRHWSLVIALTVLSILTHAQAQSPGTALWTNRYPSPFAGPDRALAAAVDGSGNVIVTGVSNGSGGRSDYATIKYSAEGVPLWTNRYDGPGNNSDDARAIAVDGSGNVFVTGFSFGSGSYYDYVTIKYSGVGVPLWTNRYIGPGNNHDYARAIAADSSGNLVVTGFSYDHNTNSDYATIKYSGDGIPLWTNRYNGPANDDDYAYALAVDASGNVFVTGASYGGGAGEDYATIKYSSAGIPLWTNRYDGPLGSEGPVGSEDLATAVVVDGGGNVIVTGYSIGSSGSYDFATIKYSGAGVPLWTNRYDGPGNGYEQVTGIAVDANGNVFVTGDSFGNGTDTDFATIKYSGAGVPLWTNRYDGGGGSTEEASGVVVDGSGKVFVTGYSLGIWSGRDYATISYSEAGMPLWTNRYDGPGSYNDRAFALAVDRNGNVFVTGESWNDTDYDYATIKYSSAATPSLIIARTTTNTVVVSWPSPADGWLLHATTNLIATGLWTEIPPPYQTQGGKLQFTEPVPAGNKFYRLHKP